MKHFAFLSRFQLTACLKCCALVVLLFTLLESSAKAQDQILPASDPAREWLGAEYADVVFSEFQRLHPEISLVIDEADLSIKSPEKRWNLKEAARAFKTNWEISGNNDEKRTLRQRLVQAFKQALPPVFSAIAGTLEFGTRIEFNESSKIEASLLQWINTKPDGSVAPHELMAEALRLTNGHVIAAWAATWNFTREGWERAAIRNYGSLQSKFMSLTGERHLWSGGAHFIVLPEKEWTEVDVEITRGSVHEQVKAQKRLKMIVSKRGDEFSYLYHRIGVELFSMITAKLTDSAKLGWVLGTAGALGEFLKYPAAAGLRTENIKRINNDRLAASSGARLFQLVTGKAQLPNSGFKRGPWNYLKRNVKKFGYSYAVPADRPPQYFGSNVDKKFFSNTMSIEELEMRFYHATHVDSIILAPIMLATTGEAERLHRGLTEYMKAGANNENLNTYIRERLERVSAAQITIQSENAFSWVSDVKQDLNLVERYNLPVARELISSFDFAEYERWLLRLLTKVLDTAEATKQRAPAKPMKAPTSLESLDAIRSCKDIFTGAN